MITRYSHTMLDVYDTRCVFNQLDKDGVVRLVYGNGKYVDDDRMHLPASPAMNEAIDHALDVMVERHWQDFRKRITTRHYILFQPKIVLNLQQH